MIAAQATDIPTAITTDARPGPAATPDSAATGEVSSVRPLLYRMRRAARAALAILSGQRPPVPKDGFSPAGGLVVAIAPHPDDEIVGCGGTLARHLAAGDSVAVLYLTRGGNSRGFPWLTPAQRRQARMNEARAGCTLLGITDLTFLTGNDAHLSDPAESRQLETQLADYLKQRRPARVYVPHRADAHADHRAAYRAAWQILKGDDSSVGGGSMDGSARGSAGGFACELFEYEVWSPLEADFAVDVTAQHRLKVRALRRHRSALDAFDYIATISGLSRYRSGTLLQRKGYAEAFRRGS